MPLECGVSSGASATTAARQRSSVSRLAHQKVRKCRRVSPHSRIFGEATLPKSYNRDVDIVAATRGASPIFDRHHPNREVIR